MVYVRWYSSDGTHVHWRGGGYFLGGYTFSPLRQTTGTVSTSVKTTGFMLLQKVLRIDWWITPECRPSPAVFTTGANSSAVGSSQLPQLQNIHRYIPTINLQDYIDSLANHTIKPYDFWERGPPLGPPSAPDI